MSDSINDASEIFETLENLEQSIIEYEDSLNEQKEDTSLIHIIFRYAHNLKSTLAMARKERSSELIHSVESRFDGIRSGKEKSSSELIDCSLRAIDLIKYSLQENEEDEEALLQLKEEVEGLTGTEIGKGERGTVDFPLERDERKKAEEELRAGKSLFLIEKLITADIDEESFSQLPIYQDIADVGTLIVSYPPFHNLNRKGEETTIKLLFSSSESADELYYSIFDPFREVVLPGDTGDSGAEAPEKVLVPEVEKPADVPAPLVSGQSVKEPGQLAILIVEDDFVTRHLEESLLSSFGECEVAVNGREAVRAFEVKFLSGAPYDLVLLDILIPEIDGMEVLRRIRDFEEEKGRIGLERSKVIIVSNKKDMDTISQSFRDQSDAYIIKPVTRKKVETHLRKLGLLA